MTLYKTHSRKTHSRVAAVLGALLLTTPAVSAFSQEMDKRDQQTLEKIPPAEMVSLDAKLREAMSLYYDNAYHLALPLFRDIAARVDTLDILYWYGTTAWRSGQSDLAIIKFQTMLDRHPELHYVRLDLALAYLQKGDHETAKAELQKVLDSGSSEVDQEKIARVMEGIERMDKRFFVSLRFSGGVQVDDNINAQPDDAISDFTAEKVDGVGVPLSASVDLLYDFGKKQDWIWRNRLSLYQLDHNDSSIFDYFQVDFRTGPEYSGKVDGKAVRLKMPVGVVDRRFGHSGLSDSWYLSPEASYSPIENLDLKLAYRFEDESFDTSGLQNNFTNTLSFGPSWIMQSPGSDRLGVVSLQVGYANREAVGNQYSYEQGTIGPSWFQRHDFWGLESFVSARYQDRSYEGNSLVAGISTPTERQDRQWEASAMLSKTIQKKYSVSASYGYAVNDSNDARFDYDKSVFGVNLGVNLDY